MHRDTVHELGLLIALLATLATVLAIALVQGPTAVTGVGLDDLTVFLAGGLTGVSLPRRTTSL